MIFLQKKMYLHSDTKFTIIELYALLTEKENFKISPFFVTSACWLNNMVQQCVENNRFMVEITKILSFVVAKILILNQCLFSRYEELLELSIITSSGIR